MRRPLLSTSRLIAPAVLASCFAGCATEIADDEEEVGTVSQAFCTLDPVTFAPPGYVENSGDIVQIMASAECDGAEVAKFRTAYRLKGTKVFTPIHPWSFNGEWNTTGLPNGLYELRTRAHAVGTPGTGLSQEIHEYAIGGEPCSGLTLEKLDPSPYEVGTATDDFVATADCPSGTAQYQFLVRRAGSTVFDIEQDWGTSGSFSWDTSEESVGTHRVLVRVRTQGFASVYEQKRASGRTIVDCTLTPGAEPCLGVVSTSPKNGKTGVHHLSNVGITFAQAMNPSTLVAQTANGGCTGTVQLSYDGFGSCVAMSSASPVMSAGNTVATFDPLIGMFVGTGYQIRVTTGALDAGNAPLPAPYTTSPGFVTGSATGVDDGNTGTTTWTHARSPYWLNQVTVEAGATLTIEPGTEVWISGDDWDNITVNGTLNAEGVRFRSPYAAGQADWRGIAVSPTGTIDLDGATIQNSIYGLEFGSGSWTIDGLTVRDSNGGIHSSMGNLTLTNLTTIGGGTAIRALNGGTVSVNGAVMTNTWNGVFVQNGATVNLTNVVARGGDSTFFAQGGSGTITNCTIYGQSGNAIHNGGVGSVTVVNTIAVGNAIGFMNNGGGAALASYSNFFGNTTANTQNVTLGTAIFNFDPSFVSAPSDLSLQANSGCIDTGTDTGVATDVNGDPRPVNGNGAGGAEYDLGAYEYSP